MPRAKAKTVPSPSAVQDALDKQMVSHAVQSLVKERETKTMPTVAAKKGIVVPLKGVATGFQPVPEDTYRCTFTAWKNGTTKNNDFMITLENTVQEPAEYAGRKLFVNQVVIPEGEKANLHYLKEALVYLGADPADLEGALDTDEILQQLRGNSVVVQAKIGQYNGKDTNNCSYVDPDAWGN